MSDTVTVQPREIRDCVYRATRLSGADHGVATLVARRAMAAGPQIGAHLAGLLARLEAGAIPDYELDVGTPTGGDPIGTEVPVELWGRLVEAAAHFLVPERTIDDAG